MKEWRTAEFSTLEALVVVADVAAEGRLQQDKIAAATRQELYHFSGGVLKALQYRSSCGFSHKKCIGRVSVVTVVP